MLRHVARMESQLSWKGLRAFLVAGVELLSREIAHRGWPVCAEWKDGNKLGGNAEFSTKKVCKNHLFDASDFSCTSELFITSSVSSWLDC